MKGKIKVRQIHGRKYLLLVTLLDSYNSHNEQEESVDMFTFDEILEFIKATSDSRLLKDALIDATAHFTQKTFSTRPCSTCKLVSELLGKSFGCVKKRLA
jgi:hypothetical protein